MSKSPQSVRTVTPSARFNLLNFVAAAFAQQSVYFGPPLKPSKRHPVESLQTGPGAALAYVYRRRISRSHASSIKKLNRQNAIHNCEAIDRYGVPGRREVKIAKRAMARTAPIMAA